MAHRMDVDGIIDKVLRKQVQDTGQQYAVPPMEATFSTAKCFWGCLLLCDPRQSNLISSPLVKRYVCKLDALLLHRRRAGYRWLMLRTG